jgi:polysaccharide biosynthesis protein VpsM
MEIKSSFLLSCIAISVILPVSLPASPLVSIGDNMDVFFNGSSSLRWSSNVFRDGENEVDDLIFTVSPGFEVNVGRGISNMDLSIITRYDIIRYDDRSDLDTETSHIKAVGSYKSSRLDLNGSVSFDEQQSSTGNGDSLKGELIESEITAASLKAEYRVSPKISFGSGVLYSDTNYTSHDQLADRESTTIPFDVFYELTPKVDLSLGYKYGMTEVGETRSLTSSQRIVGEYDSVNHFFNVGARGNLLPKLSGFFKVGYRTRSSDDSPVLTTTLPLPGATTTTTTSRSDTGSMGLDADFTWTATPKITARLGLSRDFGVGGEGDVTLNSSVDLSASYSINSFLAASANLGYTLREYQDGIKREDDQYVGGVRLSYSSDQYWNFSTGYTYAENESTDVQRSYQSHTLDLTATLRY